MSSGRLFVAITIPERIKSELHALQVGIPGVRWVDPERMVLTVRFIGEADGTLFNDIDYALSTVSVPPIGVALKSVGHFPPRKDKNELWVGVNDPEPILRLRGKIDNAVTRVSVEPERRRYHPHVKLGYLRPQANGRLARFLQANALALFTPFVAESFELYASHKSGDGRVYEVEESYPLTGPGEVETCSDSHEGDR